MVPDGAFPLPGDGAEQAQPDPERPGAINARVSTYMRNIETRPWLNDPKLHHRKHRTKDRAAAEGSTFQLDLNRHRAKRRRVRNEHGNSTNSISATSATWPGGGQAGVLILVSLWPGRYRLVFPRYGRPLSAAAAGREYREGPASGLRDQTGQGRQPRGLSRPARRDAGVVRCDAAPVAEQDRGRHDLLVDVSDRTGGGPPSPSCSQLQAERCPRISIPGQPIKIRVIGTYHEFGEFVSGLAALPRIVTIHDVQIQPRQHHRPGDGGDRAHVSLSR